MNRPPCQSDRRFLDHRDSHATGFSQAQTVEWVVPTFTPDASAPAKVRVAKPGKNRIR